MCRNQYDHFSLFYIRKYVPCLLSFKPEIRQYNSGVQVYHYGPSTMSVPCHQNEANCISSQVQLLSRIIHVFVFVFAVNIDSLRCVRYLSFGFIKFNQENSLKLQVPG